MEGIQTFKGSWPWPWPWIRPYGIPSCITHRPLPIYQISFKSKKLFVDGRTYRRTGGHFSPILLGRLLEVDLIMTMIMIITIIIIIVVESLAPYSHNVGCQNCNAVELQSNGIRTALESKSNRGCNHQYRIYKYTALCDTNMGPLPLLFFSATFGCLATPFCCMSLRNIIQFCAFYCIRDSTCDPACRKVGYNILRFRIWGTQNCGGPGNRCVI